MNKMIYLDNAATTKTNPDVVKEMLPYFTEEYGNPSSIYRFANKPEQLLIDARESLAGMIGAKASELYFTACGSESDNWAIKGVAAANRSKGNHIITSKIEHHAVLHTCMYLEKNGYEVTYLDVDEYGFIDLEQLKQSIKPATVLISIMFANNEIGTIEPIKEIGAIAKENKILFHTDAVQAFGHIPIDVNELNIDLMSTSAHKLNGPKGVGFLYIRKGTRIDPLIHGGAQESNRRAGTENTAGIAGFKKAAEIAMAEMEARDKKQRELRDYLIDRVMNEIEYVRLDGPKENRLSNNAHFAFRFIEGEALLMMLDNEGICASSGSACTSGSLDPSHVLLAIGLPHEIAHGSLRLSLNWENTKEEMDHVVEALKRVVYRLRQLSPLYDDFINENK